MIGVATSSTTPDPGSPDNHITFNFTKWFDSTSPNYTGLKSYVGPGQYAPIGGASGYTTAAKVWVDPYNPSTQQTYPSTFTPFLARIATRSSGWISRFNTMAVFFIDNHFYIIVGLGGSTDRPALCFRIPFNASQPAGLGHTSSGAVAVDMWYTNGSGQAGFWPIDSTKPILFTDDDGATSGLYNPPVPLANAELKDNTGAFVHSPAGGFPYPLTGTPQSLWLTSTAPFGGVPVKVHRFAYNYSNSSNPFTITTPYQIDMSSGNCLPIGSCKLPSTYNAINPPVAAIYPIDTSGDTFGFVAAVDASCNSTYYGSGLLPFTVSGMNLY